MKERLSAKEKHQIQLSRTRWQNRRRIAYISLWSMIGVVVFPLTIATLGGVEVASILKEYTSIISTFIVTSGGIIGAYVGFSTLDKK